jgi:hypothetical protein
VWRWFIRIAIVVFGIVPATFSLLANGLYYFRGLTEVPEGAAVTVVWSQIAAICLLGLAGLVGYVALFLLAAGRASGRVVIGLLVGVVAMICAIWLGLTPVWLGSPVIVGLAYAAGYYIRGPRAADASP